MNVTPGSSVLHELAKMQSRLDSRRPRLLVVGDVMLDRYVRGKANRLSPEAPAPIVDVNDETSFAGGAANVMHNLASLGVEVIGLSVTGSDDCGRQIRQLLTDSGVNTDRFVSESGRKTPEKIRVHTDSHQLLRIDRESTESLSPELESELLSRIDLSTGEFAAVVLCDYSKGVLTPRVIQELIGRARQHDIPVLVDPKGIDASRYQGATLISPNRQEAERLAGVETQSDEALDLAGRTLAERTHAKHVVITLAEDGMVAFGETPLQLPAIDCNVRDVSGAGDTFLAAMAIGFACGIPFTISAEIARAAAAVAVSRHGTATVTLQDIEQALKNSRQVQAEGDADPVTIPFPGVAEMSDGEHSTPNSESDAAPIRSEWFQARTIKEITNIAERAHKDGQSIVFTNGCFDLLHPGHVSYLEGSRQCGDLLIVGLNSDSSVLRLKGRGRPVHAEEDRVRMLLALRCVDYVVIFDDDTPTNLIRAIQPNVLTKGGDYTVEQVVGAELVEDVRLIPFVTGQSTTATISRIRDAG